MTQARPGGLQHAIEVLEGLLGLAVEITLADDLAIVADSGLAGDENQMAQLDCLGQQKGCVGIGTPRGFDTFNDFLIGLSGPKSTRRADQLAEIGKARNMAIGYSKAKRPTVTPAR